MSDDDSKEDLYIQNCPTCGVVFGIPAKMEKIWRNNHNKFYCVNGHELSWKETPETEDQKEVKKLRKEVSDLKTKLAAAEKKADEAEQKATNEKKRADELASELEIWRPNNEEKKN